MGSAGKRSIGAFLLVGALALPAGAETYRLACWNILHFNYTSYPPPGHDRNRVDGFRAVLTHIDPDIVVVQEMVSEAACTFFLHGVLNHPVTGEYTMAPFADGPNSDNGCFYRPTLQYDGTTHYLNPAYQLRYISEYRFSIQGATVRFYSIHLKAGSTITDMERRYDDAAYLRRDVLNDLPPGSLFFLCGDLNVQNVAEPAFQEFLMDQSTVPGEDNDGRTRDPLGQSWAYEHLTQSTRDSESDPGDDGARGGLDDRFDHILVSDALMGGRAARYLPGSFTVYWNDGRHFNQSILDPPFLDPPGLPTREHLHNASDHLPLYLDFEITPPAMPYWVVN